MEYKTVSGLSGSVILTPAAPPSFASWDLFMSYAHSSILKLFQLVKFVWRTHCWSVPCQACFQSLSCMPSLFRMAVAPPSYCFVAFPPRAKDGLVVFGKNSARPRDEVQEVVYFSAANHEPGSEVEVSRMSQSQRNSLSLALPGTPWLLSWKPAH